MKTFRDLYISLNGTDFEELPSLFESYCRPPWSRMEDKEGGLGLSGPQPYCYESDGSSGLSPAALFLFQKAPGTWYVSNIVPTQASELNYDEYNSVLEHFFEHVVKPAISDTKIRAEITTNEISIGSVAGKEVEDALKRFSNLANKSTGSSHPLDRERWFEFLLLAHDAHSTLDVDLVIRSLMEMGWADDRAHDLGVQYEFSQDLLSYAAER